MEWLGAVSHGLNGALFIRGRFFKAENAIEWRFRAVMSVMAARCATKSQTSSQPLHACRRIVGFVSKFQ